MDQLAKLMKGSQPGSPDGDDSSGSFESVDSGNYDKESD